MTLRFAYTRPDNGLSIVIAASRADLEHVLGPLTDAQYRAHVVARSIPPNATDVHELPETWVPPDIDRTFRNAWRKAGLVFSVDMPAARNIWRDVMRRARAPLLADLDVQFMQALERGQATAAIAAQKQALRDVTADPAIEAASTPDALKRVWPAILGRG